MQSTISVIFTVLTFLTVVSALIETDISAYFSSRATKITQNSIFNKLGTSISSIGDFNGDEIDDMLIGAPSSGLSPVYVLYGKSGGLPAEISLSTMDFSQGFEIRYSYTFGVSNSAVLGDVASAAGDINNDGLQDIIMALPYNESSVGTTGMAFVIYGKTGGIQENVALDKLGLAQGFTISGTQPGHILGIKVGSAGDLNGDDIDDAFVLSHKGLYVIFGRQGGIQDHIQANSSLDVSQVLKIEASSAGMYYSNAASAGDFNKDGVDDLILSTVNSVYVIYGKKGGFQAHIDVDTSFDYSKGFKIDGPASFSDIGKFVTSIGDINKDGIRDIAFVGRDPISSYNNIYVLFGKQGGIQAPINLNVPFDPLQGFTIQDPQPAFHSDEFAIGEFVGAGDFNNDGIDDIITAGSIYSKYRICVLYGKQEANINIQDELNDLPGFTVIDEDGYYFEKLGVSGDFNNDGIPDLLVSTPSLPYTSAVRILYSNGTVKPPKAPQEESPSTPNGGGNNINVSASTSEGLSTGVIVIIVVCPVAVVFASIFAFVKYGLPKIRGTHKKIAPAPESVQVQSPISPGPEFSQTPTFQNQTDIGLYNPDQSLKTNNA